jgi:hypothetical protein
MAIIKRALEPLIDLQKCASFIANKLWEKTSKRTIIKFTWTAINYYWPSIICSFIVAP